MALEEVVMDALMKFKERAKEQWSGFAPIEMATGTAAPKLVRFADVRPGAKVLDVACGTGVVALTAARVGAVVTGIDLTPVLLERAKENAAIMRQKVEWHEADVESLPFKDQSFDVVLSQFGHMFAPRPDVAIREMLRVLKPGGLVAFSTWPAELFVGRLFQLVGRYSTPVEGAAPPWQWGVPDIVATRLGTAVRDLRFDRGHMFFQTLSPQHQCTFMERNLGPVAQIVRTLESDAPRLAQFREDLEDLITFYFDDNHLRQDYLLTRAVKAP